jgi:nascent polypeptide-associated complex subunit alpha
MNSQAQLSAAQQLASGGGAAQTLEKSGVAGGGDDDDDIPELEAPEEEGEVDETGVDPKDIDLVMQQARSDMSVALSLLTRLRLTALAQKPSECSRRAAVT